VIFWGIFGSISLAMVLVVIAEKANRKRLLEGTRRELAAHERRRQQSTLSEYHEPGGWGR
jgi:heme exporter protein D